jgi:hypothetical protein
MNSFKIGLKELSCWTQWLKPIIAATQETEIKTLRFEARLDKKFKTPSQPMAERGGAPVIPVRWEV